MNKEIFGTGFPAHGITCCVAILSWFKTLPGSGEEGVIYFMCLAFLLFIFSFLLLVNFLFLHQNYMAAAVYKMVYMYLFFQAVRMFNHHIWGLCYPV